MIVLVASRWDQASHDLASRWSAFDARVLTPRDLSRPGWRQRLGEPARSTAVIDGEVVPEESITSVLVRLPFVSESELVHVADVDKSYSAAEMTAFLSFWLGNLSCPIFNRPTSDSLLGPDWPPEIWARAAARSGFFVKPLLSHTPEAMPSPSAAMTASSMVTVIGEHCFGERSLHAAARNLARAADVSSIGIYFDSSEDAAAGFLGVNLLPDLSDEKIAASMLELLLPQDAAKAQR